MTNQVANLAPQAIEATRGFAPHPFGALDTRRVLIDIKKPTESTTSLVRVVADCSAGEDVVLAIVAGIDAWGGPDLSVSRD